MHHWATNILQSPLKVTQQDGHVTWFSCCLAFRLMLAARSVVLVAIMANCRCVSECVFAVVANTAVVLQCCTAPNGGTVSLAHCLPCRCRFNSFWFCSTATPSWPVSASSSSILASIHTSFLIALSLSVHHILKLSFHLSLAVLLRSRWGETTDNCPSLSPALTVHRLGLPLSTARLSLSLLLLLYNPACTVISVVQEEGSH